MKKPKFSCFVKYVGCMYVIEEEHTVTAILIVTKSSYRAS